VSERLIGGYGLISNKVVREASTSTNHTMQVFKKYAHLFLPDQQQTQVSDSTRAAHVPEHLIDAFSVYWCTLAENIVLMVEIKGKCAHKKPEAFLLVAAVREGLTEVNYWSGLDQFVSLLDSPLQVLQLQEWKESWDKLPKGGVDNSWMNQGRLMHRILRFCEIFVAAALLPAPFVPARGDQLEQLSHAKGLVPRVCDIYDYIPWECLGDISMHFHRCFKRMYLHIVSPSRFGAQNPKRKWTRIQGQLCCHGSCELWTKIDCMFCP
jgi:hypothetical protein